MKNKSVKVPETIELTLTAKGHRGWNKHLKVYEEANTYMKVVKVFSPPNAKCSKCHGRGFTSYCVTSGNFKLCKCVLRIPNEIQG